MLTDDERRGIHKKHVEDGAASVVRVMVALAISEMSLLLWIVPEYGRDFSFGPAPESVTVIGVKIPVYFLPLVFAMIFLILVVLARTLHSLCTAISASTFNQSELELFLGRRPTALNLFLIPKSTVEFVASAMLLAIAVFSLFMPSTLAVGGYVKSPMRGSPVAILGPALIFAVPATVALRGLFLVLSRLGASDSWMAVCYVASILTILLSAVAFYLVT